MYNFLYQTVLDIFYYIFWDKMSQKIRQDKHFELYQAFLIKCSNTSKLYTADASKALLSPNWVTTDALKTLHSKNWFLYSDIQKFHHRLGCYASSINFLFNFFLKL